MLKSDKTNMQNNKMHKTEQSVIADIILTMHSLKYTYHVFFKKEFISSEVIKKYTVYQ